MTNANVTEQGPMLQQARARAARVIVAGAVGGWLAINVIAFCIPLVVGLTSGGESPTETAKVWLGRAQWVRVPFSLLVASGAWALTASAAPGRERRLAVSTRVATAAWLALFAAELLDRLALDTGYWRALGEFSYLAKVLAWLVGLLFVRQLLGPPSSASRLAGGAAVVAAVVLVGRAVPLQDDALGTGVAGTLMAFELAADAVSILVLLRLARPGAV